MTQTNDFEVGELAIGKFSNSLYIILDNNGRIDEYGDFRIEKTFNLRHSTIMMNVTVVKIND